MSNIRIQKVCQERDISESNVSTEFCQQSTIGCIVETNRLVSKSIFIVTPGGAHYDGSG